MSQALSEFRSPVGQEALRLRMVAMHGREDALLDAARFPRLLRQANDAEVADVRKVGDDDYEIVAQGSPLRPAPAPESPAEADSQPVAPAEPMVPPSAASSAGRENGQRLGLRFRRGSRAPMRAGEVPLVGVVEIEPPTPSAQSEPSIAAPPISDQPPPKRPRPRRSRKAPPSAAADAGGKGGTSAEATPTPEAAAPRRPRPRSRKKTTE
jgi:hypothetical protein